jgi:cytochrome bd-type quinol oxidase subunit 2
MVQEHCISKYNATVEELLYHSFLGSTIISFVLSVISGELFEGIIFLIKKGDVHTLIGLAAFCTFGFAGANFSTGLTLRFGSLVNGITNTARKAVTLALSFALFPERNVLTSQHVLGACIFFCGLIVRTVSKDKHKSHRGKKKDLSSKAHHKSSSSNLTRGHHGLSGLNGSVGTGISFDSINRADGDHLTNIYHDAVLGHAHVDSSEHIPEQPQYSRSDAIPDHMRLLAADIECGGRLKS